MLKLRKVPLSPLKPAGPQTRRSFQKHEPGSPKNLAKGLCQLEGGQAPATHVLALLLRLQALGHLRASEARAQESEGLGHRSSRGLAQ